MSLVLSEKLAKNEPILWPKMGSFWAFSRPTAPLGPFALTLGGCGFMLAVTHELVQ
jgi:hypothetical protein